MPFPPEHSPRDPFVVPEGYLEALPGRLMQRIDALPSTSLTATARPRRAKLLGLYARYAAGVAATVALLITFARTADAKFAAEQQGNPATVQLSDVGLAEADAAYDYLLFDNQMFYDDDLNE